MHINRHNSIEVHSLQKKLQGHGLVYGQGQEYGSLLSPASVYLSSSEAKALAHDTSSLAALYRTTIQLYLESVQGNAPAWIKSCADHGLSPTHLNAHRLVAQAGLEPLMMRVDYVTVSENKRQIAEIQWKSGGPGLIIGHDLAFRDLFPFEGTVAFGDPVNEYLDTLTSASPDENKVIINEARGGWLQGEAFLSKAAQSRGFHYLPIDRAELSRQLTMSSHDFFVKVGNQKHSVRLLRGRGFTEVLDDSLITRLAQDSVEGKLWIETPLNFLYRQKWCLSLPFLPQFRDLFEDRLRSILIPTALVLGEQIDLTEIAKSIALENDDRIADIKLLEQLPRLPASLRGKLVLKCASGVGNFHSRGRGVFRLSGSRSNAEKIVEFIRGRVLVDREPWIIQPYVNSKYEIPIALPGETTTRSILAHMRLMLFGGRNAENDWKAQGAVGNFSKQWKVSGAPGQLGNHGVVLGSAFTDVRIMAD